MNSAVTVPVNIEPEATDYIARRGYQDELDQYLAKACQFIPELRVIEVKLVPDDEGWPEGGILITAFTRSYTSATRAAVSRCYDWARAAFGFEVQEVFAVLATAGGTHAG
jgi:hypothetical protein